VRVLLLLLMIVFSPSVVAGQAHDVARLKACLEAPITDAIISEFFGFGNYEMNCLSIFSSYCIASEEKDECYEQGTSFLRNQIVQTQEKVAKMPTSDDYILPSRAEFIANDLIQNPSEIPETDQVFEGLKLNEAQRLHLLAVVDFLRIQLDLRTYEERLAELAGENR